MSDNLEISDAEWEASAAAVDGLSSAPTQAAPPPMVQPELPPVPDGWEYPLDFVGCTPPQSLWRSRRIGIKFYENRFGPPEQGLMHLAGTGTKKAPVMFISPCALQEELRTGYSSQPACLKGAPGNLFRRNLGRTGFQDEDWFYTNLVKYNLPRLKPKAADIRWSLPALLDEIEVNRPKIIVCLGKPAFDVLLKLKLKVDDVQGAFFRSEEHDCLIYVMDAITRPLLAPEYLERFITDLKQVKKALNETRGIIIPKVAVEYTTLTRTEHLGNLLADLKRQQVPWVAVDSEWQGQTYVSGHLRLFQWAWAPGRAAAVHFTDEKGNYLFDRPVPEVAQALSPFFNDPKLKFIGHYGAADAVWMRHHLNIEVYQRFMFDTMFAQHTIDEAADLKLERLAVRYTDLGRYDLDLTIWKKQNKFDEEENEGYGKVPDDILVPYSMRDVDCTIRCFPILLHKLQEQGLLDYYFNFCNPFVTDGFVELSETGIPINKGYLDEMREIFIRNRDLLNGEFRKAVHAEAQGSLTCLLMNHGKDPMQGLTLYQQLFDLQREHYKELGWEGNTLYLKPLGPMPASVEFEDAVELLQAFIGPERWAKVIPVFMHWWESPGFGINSAEHLRRWLFDVKGFTPIKTTKKDGITMGWDRVLSLPKDKQAEYTPAADKQTVKVFADKDAMVGQLQELKSVNNIVKSFLPGVDEDGRERGIHKWIQPDNRVHANFSLTETARPRAWKPNILNWPKYVAKPIEKAFARLMALDPALSQKPTSLRSAAEAPEGWALIDMDLQTAEVVALAYLSGDENMIRVLTEEDSQFGRIDKNNPKKVVRLGYNANSGYPQDAWDHSLIVAPDDPRLLRRADGSILHPKRDLHWEFGETVAGKSREKLDEEASRGGVGKVGNFSIPYGASGTALERLIEANTGKKPEPGTGDRMIQSYATRYPIAQQFLEWMERQVTDPGFYRALSGRVRHFAAGQVIDLEGLSEYTKKGILQGVNRQARNFPMQNLVADTTGSALVSFLAARRRLGLSGRVMMLLYDAMTVLCPLDELKVTVPVLRDCLTVLRPWEAHGRKFHFDVDVAVTKRWGVKPTKDQKAIFDQWMA